MANVTITQLPAAGTITGTESVPIVQNGQTVRTTTGAIAASPSQVYTYLTTVQTPQLPNSRYFGATNGLTFTDGGAQGLFNVTTTGALSSLVGSGTGLQVKTDSVSITGRTLNTSGSGLSVTDGNGIGGNPTFQLTGLAQSIANMSGSGLVALRNNSFTPVTINGTANQITVTNGDALNGNPTIAIADNPTFSGTGAMLIPIGTTDSRPAGVSGKMRYNSSLAIFEGYSNGNWNQFVFSGGIGSVTSVNVSGGTTGLTTSGGPITASGTITLGGVLDIDNGGTGATTANTALNNLLPNQSGNSGKVLGTDGSTTSWVANGDVSLNGVQTLTNKTLVSPRIQTTASAPMKLYGDNVSASYTPFAQTFFSSVTDFNGYQLNYIQNENNGSDASVDYVAYNDASDVNSYFIDMGISSSNYISPSFPIFPANGGYVYTGGGASGQASALLLGTSNSASDLVMFTGGTEIANTRATIKGNTGNVLIGTGTLSDTGEKLQVTGSTKITGATTFGSTVTLSADPTLALQAATKQYVDNAASGGFTIQTPVRLATTDTLAALTGGSVTYSNGTLGVGATLTLGNALTTLDGVSLSNGNRVLVKDEVNQAHNGVYTWATGGTVLTRATDFDTASEIVNNSYFLVSEGTVDGGSAFVLSQSATIVVGTTPLPFPRFSDQLSYTGTAPINVTGTTISLVGAVPATNGGTGTQTTTTGDLLYGNVGNTWSKLAVGIQYKSLIVGSGGVPEWNAIPLNESVAVAGQLGIINGGTGQTTASAAFNALSPITTTGDLIIGNGSNSATRLAISASSGYVLTSNGTTASWQAPTGGGGGISIAKGRFVYV